MIFDSDTGNSKRYGFVEMDDDEDIEAIEKLNDSEQDGSQIVVKKTYTRPHDGKRNDGNRSGNHY